MEEIEFYIPLFVRLVVIITVSDRNYKVSTIYNGQTNELL